jgi:hypothetical protein
MLLRTSALHRHRRRPCLSLLFLGDSQDQIAALNVRESGHFLRKVRDPGRLGLCVQQAPSLEPYANGLLPTLEIGDVLPSPNDLSIGHRLLNEGSRVRAPNAQT